MDMITDIRIRLHAKTTNLKSSRKAAGSPKFRNHGVWNGQRVILLIGEIIHLSFLQVIIF